MSETQAVGKKRSVAESLQEYARGIVGGLLVSLPLLYTMEVWWAGLSLSPLRLLMGLLAAYVLLLGYNRYAGLRADASFAEVAIDSVEELGLGLVVATVVLWLLRQLESSMTLSDMLGKIIVEGMTVAIGVSVGTAQLGGDSEETGMAGDGDQQAALGQNKDESELQRFGGQLIIALCGAVLFAANVGPTEEIIQVAFEASPWRLFTLAALSLLMGGVILFFGNFRGTRQLFSGEGWPSIVPGILVTYAVALVASAAMLWFFDRFDGLGLYTAVGAVVVLGVAATLGATAGRMLLQGNQS